MTAVSEDTIRKKCEQEPWCKSSRNFVKFGNIPAWFENISDMMPESSTEKQDYKAAAALARDIYRQQALQSLNPADVEKLCQVEPWTTAPSVDKLENGVFGYVTEKLEKARDLFDRDSPEFKAYHEAFEKAKLIYFESIHNYSQIYARGKSRAQIEEINVLLWGKAHIYEGDRTYRSSRMIKLCELMSDYQRMLNNPPAHDSTKGQFVVRAPGNLGGGPA